MLAILQHCHHKECTVKFSFEIPGQVTITVVNPANKKSYAQCLPWDHITDQDVIGAIDFCIEKTKQTTLRDLQLISIKDLKPSVRLFTQLNVNRIYTLAELVQYDADMLKRKRNFGPKCLCEVELLLHNRGLKLGMDLSQLPD
jgi:DNA-directed RNA polymerase alpha subunit